MKLSAKKTTKNKFTIQESRDLFMLAEYVGMEDISQLPFSKVKVEIYSPGPLGLREQETIRLGY